MASLADLLAIHTDLPGRAARRLQRIAGEWQLLADLSFADLRLWVREDPEGDSAEPAYICIAQCRPNTTPTVYDSDGVGVVVQPWEAPRCTPPSRARTWSRVWPRRGPGRPGCAARRCPSRRAAR
ncbi:hypothetical protein MTP03_35860 [Tsukamurella sp. PLM1]|nr:hypothetical protein MTP03_35860 [Tsukamurella sp. PLM1]